MEERQDLISRQAAIDAMANTLWHYPNECYRNLNEYEFAKGLAELGLKSVPSAQPEQRYTEEELRVFQHGISLSLLSKRSAQHWQYDENTTTEIKFLERLYEKVGADIRGEEV